MEDALKHSSSSSSPEPLHVNNNGSSLGENAHLPLSQWGREEVKKDVREEWDGQRREYWEWRGYEEREKWRYRGGYGVGERRTQRVREGEDRE